MQHQDSGLGNIRDGEEDHSLDILPSGKLSDTWRRRQSRLYRVLSASGKEQGDYLKNEHGSRQLMSRSPQVVP